jgi:hypothetical protein
VADWDEDALAMLRSAAYRRDGVAGIEALGDRRLGPVLQYAGDVLVAALLRAVPGAEGAARTCLAALDERALPGDAELAADLAVALGAPRAAIELTEVPVDLATLGPLLEGDEPGPRVIDLVRGEILDEGETNPAFDEWDETYDPGRWLSFWPVGPPAPDTDLADLAGRDERHWWFFQEERQRGRTRHWLATQGYRPGPRTL